MKLTWCVVSFVSPAPPPLYAAHDTVRDLTLSGWIMVLVVEEERLHCLIAVILVGEMLAVAITRMPVRIVTLRDCNILFGCRPPHFWGRENKKKLDMAL